MAHFPADPLLGITVGSFRVERLLGRGGMGSVYLASHPVIGSKVAVKFLHESMSASPALVRRFHDEARAVNLVGHENIVAIHDLVPLPGQRYAIVMEYLEGRHLSDLLRSGPLALDDALDILLQLADALRAAHAAGVIHRDLKPENVFLVDRRGHRHFVKLMDFGIAKLLSREEGTGQPTGAGILVGTPEYMAPEQVEHGLADARTDVYALGVLAYQLGTGQLPFVGEAVAQVLLAQLQRPPRPPRQLVPSMPPAFEALVLRALKKRPEDRFQDMRALASALEAVRAGARVGEGPGEATSPPVPPASSAPQGPLLTVTWEGGRASQWPARLVTRGGLFLRGEAPPPPLLASVRLSGESPRGALALRGEVVRHVSPGDAARWGMAAGFAVQLRGIEREDEVGLAALFGAETAAPPQPPPGGVPLGREGSEAQLAALERSAASGPYALLALPLDAGFAEVHAAASALRSTVEALRPALSPVDQTTRVAELLVRLDAARTLLGTPAERLMFDARHGNFGGVSRCITAGVPAAVLAARRTALLSAQPERASEAARQLARARMANRLGNAEAALKALEAALAADPFDEEARAAWGELARPKG